MPSDEQAAAVAWNTVGGSGSLGYDIANSDCILAVGANFMDSWGTVAHNRAVFKETHPTGENAEQAIYYAGAMQNNTAVVADTWLPVKPGTEEIFLGAVLSELIKNNIMADSSLSALASRYSIEEAGKACGTDTEQMKKTCFRSQKRKPSSCFCRNNGRTKLRFNCAHARHRHQRRSRTHKSRRRHGGLA